MTAADHGAGVASTLLRGVGAVSTPAAALLAEALFVKTMRPRLRPEESAFLARGERFTVRALGHRIAGYRWGTADAPRVMLVHGWWSRAGRMMAMAEGLLAAGMQVVAFDGPGHGRSTGWRGSMPEFAWTLRAVTEAVGPLHATIGHSLGGAATIFATSRGLPTSRVAVLAAPAHLAYWADRFRDTLGLAPAVDARMRDNLERRIGFSWAELDVLRAAERLAVPGLVIHDADDADVAPDQGRLIAGHWVGSALVETRGLGHRQVTRDPDVIARVVEFVRA